MRGPTLAIFAALLLLHTTYADKCRTGCNGVTPNIFKYEEGTTYKYNLEGNIDISLSSAEGQQTSTKVKATVLLNQKGNCNQVIQLKNVQVIGPDAKKYNGIPNIEKPIGINFHDGHVEDVICTVPGDTQNSLNIKRAVASMFQAALKHHHESDVFGDCPTDITSRKEGQMTIIHKTRHLNRCAHRETIKQDFMATSFNDNSEIHASPLLNGEYESEQRLKNGILDHALVTENYIYKPFSNGKNGAKATVTTRLTFASTSKDAPKDEPSEGKSIHFESPHLEVIPKGSNLDSIIAAMKDAKQSMDISVTETSAKTFAQLIKVLRASTKEDILAVYGQIKTGASFKDKTSARKLYFDALFRTGTGQAVEAMVELLKNKELTPIEQKLLFLGLSFIRHATPSSLKAAAALADLKDVPREAYLGMGTLAGHYCQEHNCENLKELDAMMRKMASKLTAKPATHKDENNVIAILKGLANVHHLSDGILDKLISIANDKKAPTRVRVAVLETFLADACKQKLKESAMKILKDREEDSEIRIKAYLVAAECPCSKCANSIQELLNTEPVYQVGGFIVSHLRNLRASANPDREHAKQVLGMIKTPKKYPIDPRKYSFNTEFSYTIDSAGLGTAVDSNVIYSQNSFLPRSTSLNLTAEFFGHSFNFMEVGTRQENLDKIVEHYFGPLGVFSSHTPEELYATGKQSASKIVEHIQKRFEKTRGKRDVSKADIEAFAKTVKVPGHDHNHNLDLDLSVKILGSEMLFLSLNEEIEKLTPDAIIDRIFDELDKGIESAKNFNYHMKNHLLFLDVETSYPTSMGFPLRLNVHGTSAMHFIADGSIDIKQILSDPKNAKMKASVIPSANIELAGTIEIDAYFVETGLKVSSSILTSTGFNIDIKLLEHGKGVDVQFGLPIEKQKLISFSHDIVFSTQEHGKQETSIPLKFKDKQKDLMICFDQLVGMTGLTFCGELTTPSSLATNNVAFPLNGPVKLSVVIEREDVTKYHFMALLKDQTPDHRAIEIKFDTPGSQNKRDVELLLEAMTHPNKMLKATLKSPLKTAIAEAGIIDSDSEKSIMARFQHDTTEYYGKIGVSVQGNEAKSIYQPLIEYSTPNDIVKTKGNRKPDYHVEGQVIVEKGGDNQKYTFDNVKLVSPSSPAILINGNLAKEGKKYSTDLKVTREQINVHVKGKVDASPNKIKLNAQMENNIDENVNFHVDYEMKRAEGMISNDFNLIHGKDLKSKKQHLTIAQMLKYKYENPQKFDYETKNKITYPLVNLELKLDSKGCNKHIEYDAHLNYDKFKLESELNAKFGSKHQQDYDVKFELEAINNKLELKAKREVNGDKSTVGNMIQFNGKKYSVDGTVMHHLKANDINVGTDLVIKVAEKPDAIKVNSKLVANNKELDSMCKITMGKEVLLDMMVKGTKGANPNGNMKLFALNLINANGNFKSTDGVGNGMVLVDLPKMSRKLKAEATFTCKDPVHNLKMDVFFDFEKDDTKKIHLETNNQITQHSVDSQNKIDILGHKLEANVKGNLDGKPMNGKMTGEFDLLLPNDHYITGKMDREIHVVDNVANGNGHLSFTHQESKSGPECKFDIKAHVKDTDFKRSVFDLTYNVMAKSRGGKDIQADLVFKHVKQGEHFNSVYKSNVHGSIMPQPYELEVTGTYTSKEGTYKAHTKYGDDLGANVAGKYNLVGEGKPLIGEVDVEILTPHEQYKNMKAHAGGKLIVKEHGHFEVQGTTFATLNNDKTVKLTGHMKNEEHHGDMKVTLTVPNEEPISVSGYYGHEDMAEGSGKCKCGLEVQYAKDKNVKADMTLIRPNKEEMEFDLDLKTPADAAKHINLHLKGKRSDGGKHFNSEVHLTADDKKYSMTNELIISEVAPSLDIKITYPDQKTSRILAKFQRLAPKQFNGELKIESLQDLSLDINGEANLESVDNFQVTVNVHSDKLKLEHIKIEATNKPAKGGKKIQFSAKSGDKNLVSGSTNYKVNEENGKYIVEGSGSFKVKEQTQSANFKYIRQNLSQDKDGEQGINIVLNAAVGPQNIVGEFKLTNKQFRIWNSYCEEKQQCAHVEVYSKANSDDATHFNHELEVNIDLRKLGLSHEFGLKSVTNRKNFVLDHTVDMHFESSGNSKYQYSLYIHPKEAGIFFTMPKRTIALEGKFDVPPVNKGKLGPIKSEVAFYMNKNAEPDKKTVLSFFYEQNVNDKLADTHLEMKFNNPNLNKELMIKYNTKADIPARVAEANIELDIFGKKSNKITCHTTIKGTKLENGYSLDGDLSMISKGLNLEVKAQEHISVQPQDMSYGYTLNYHLGDAKAESQLLAKANMKEAELLVKLLNKDLMHVDAKLQLSKENQVADTTMSMYGMKSVLVSHLEIKNFNTLIYTLARKDQPKNKLQVTTGFILGQIADFRAEVLKGGAKNELVHASVKLDDANFMKPDFGVNVENIQNLVLEPMGAGLKNALEQLKTLAQDYQKLLSTHIEQLSEMIKKNAPNLKPMMEYYKTELLKMKDELMSDKTIQEVSELMKKIFGAAAHTFSDLFAKVSEITQKLTQFLQEHFAKLTDVIAKNVLPAVKDIGGKVIDFYVSIMKNVYNVTMIYLVKLSELLKEHQAELKQVATTLSEAFQDIGQMVFKALKNVRDELQHVLQELFEQVKALPVFDQLKETYEQLMAGMPVPDYIVNIISEVFSTVKDVLPTLEMKQFVGELQGYVMKKLKHEKVDDIEYLKKMYSSLMKAVNSFIHMIRNQPVDSDEVKGIFENMLPLPIETLTRLPRLMTVKFSPLRLLTSGDYPSPKHLLHQLSFNPADILPPFTHHAIIAQGQHIFTFDDRHLTFPGTCSYVLAKDVVNGNFTIIGTYKDGLLESITFSDKKDVVTVKKDHEVLVNGARSEFPVRHQGLEVFRLYETVNIASSAGVHIVCEPHLFGCGVHVSGFYHGQMRGLLGNGNNEPFDDFTMPNGKISLKEDEFGNSFSVGGGCAPVQTVDHHAHHSNPTCDSLFSNDFTLRICYPFVDTTPFKQACEHGMASNIPHTDKAIAMAYVAACRNKGIPAFTPARFVECKNSEQPTELGAKFTVKVPGKAADVVIVVEQNKDNEVVFQELISPVVTALTNDLTAKGVSDIEFSLIGYGGEYQKWPSHYSSGGKIKFHGNTASLKFVDPVESHIRTGNDQFDRILEKFFAVKKTVEQHLSMTPIGAAVREGIRYPFRAHAIKTIVVVPGKSYNNNIPVLSLLKFYVMYGQNNGLHYNLITPLEMRMKDAKQQKNIIGFNDNSAFTFSGKKVPNHDIRKDIEHGDDPAVDFMLRMRGNIFVSGNFVASKAGQRKTFAQVVSHQIADQMTNVEQTLECDCRMVNPYDAKNVCRVTSTREKESVAKKGTKGK